MLTLSQRDSLLRSAVRKSFQDSYLRTLSKMLQPHYTKGLEVAITTLLYFLNISAAENPGKIDISNFLG